MEVVKDEAHCSNCNIIFADADADGGFGHSCGDVRLVGVFLAARATTQSPVFHSNENQGFLLPFPSPLSGCPVAPLHTATSTHIMVMHNTCPHTQQKYVVLGSTVGEGEISICRAPFGWLACLPAGSANSLLVEYVLVHKWRERER